jgi:hypothetical protein
MYYTPGLKIKLNKEVFAVSGDKNKALSIGVSEDIKSVFSLLKRAEIVKKERLNNVLEFEGHPEKLSITFQFSGDNKYYRLESVLTPDSSANENQKHLVKLSSSVYANMPTVYELDRVTGESLVAIIRSWTEKDWGGAFESNP